MITDDSQRIKDTLNKAIHNHVQATEFTIAGERAYIFRKLFNMEDHLKYFSFAKLSLV